MNIALNLLATTGIACGIILIGNAIVKRVKLFQDWCFSGPVVGGLLFSLIFCILKVSGILSIKWTTSLSGFCMNVFFTACGFGASFAIINKSRKLCLGIAITVAGCIFMQDVVGVAIAKLLGLHPYLGLAIGSAAMTGGVGTAAAFGPIWEDTVSGITIVGIAAGTIGMAMGSIIGGPVAALLIRRKGLKANPEDEKLRDKEQKQAPPLNAKKMVTATALITLLAGLGVPMAKVLNMIPFVQVPPFVGGLFVGILVRNGMDIFHIHYDEPEINVVEHVSLDIFLAIAIMTIDLTKLFAFALPMLLILIAEGLLMCLWGYFITFHLCGSDYNAAVVTAGHCGMGCGAAPNAVANELAVINRYGYAHLAWIIFPGFSIIVGNIANPLLLTALTKFFA